LRIQYGVAYYAPIKTLSLLVRYKNLYNYGKIFFAYICKNKLEKNNGFNS